MGKSIAQSRHGILTGNRDNSCSLRLILLLLILGSAYGEPVEIPLYEGEIPGAIEGPNEESVSDPANPHGSLLNVSRPTLRIYLPKNHQSNRAAVIICPGGAYHHLAIYKEGYAVAEALNAIGVVAIVLKYRLPNPKIMKTPYLGPLQDLQQAIATVRRRFADLGIDSRRIGLIGFSAGGHLAATAAVNFKNPVDGSLSGTNLRPDFLILAYPVISMSAAYSHEMSRELLLGQNSSIRLNELFSMELQASDKLPPTFLMHAGDDQSVPVENSLAFYRALINLGVSTELHVYATGGHGFGLRNPTSSDNWFERLVQWLRDQGFVAREN